MDVRKKLSGVTKGCMYVAPAHISHTRTEIEFNGYMAGAGDIKRKRQADDMQESMDIFNCFA